MPLPSFTVIGNLSDILAAPTGGELTTVAWEKARVTFSHNIRSGVLVFDGNIYNRPPSVTVTPGEDGGITNVLLANDPGLNVDGVQWQVRIVVSNTLIASWWIDAPDDGEIVDLATEAHADAIPAGITTEQLAAAIAAYMAEHPGGAVSWADVLSKPTSFPPAAHTHPASDVTGLAAVATTGAYSDLTGTPTLGTAAATAATAYATAAQGVKADSAVQPGALATVATSGAYGDLSGKPTIPDALTDLDTTVSGSQLNSLKTKVDGIATAATANDTDANLKNRANHTGTQTASTISDGVRTVIVSTGSETRPTTTGVVLWIGGSSEPVNYDNTRDIWFGTA